MKLTLGSIIATIIFSTCGILDASEAGKEFQTADIALNAAYNQLLETMSDPQQKQSFVQGQVAWIKYRDANVASFSARYPDSKGGLFLNIHLTEDRTAFLNALRATSPTDDPTGTATSGDIAPAVASGGAVENKEPPQPVNPEASPSPSPEASPSPSPEESTQLQLDQKSVAIITGLFHHRGDSWFANCRFNEYRDVTELKGVTLSVNIKPIEEADKLNGVDWNADYFVQCKALRQAYRQLPSPLVKWSDWQNEEGQKPIFCFTVIHKNGSLSIRPKMRNMFGEYDDNIGLLSPSIEALPEYGQKGEQNLEQLIAEAKRPTKTISTFPFRSFYCDGTTYGAGTATLTDTSLSCSCKDSAGNDSHGINFWFAQFWSVERQRVGIENGPQAEFVASDIGAFGGGNYSLSFKAIDERDAFCTQLNSAILNWKHKYTNLRQNRYYGLKINH